MAQPVTKHHRPKTQFFSTLLGGILLRAGPREELVILPV